jgi:hypothetical protein
MITRLFLFMLAVLSGISAAQAANPVRAGESAVGVASTVVADCLSAASVCTKASQIRHYPATDSTRLAISINATFFAQTPKIIEFWGTFKSDRLLQ